MTVPFETFGDGSWGDPALANRLAKMIKRIIDESRPGGTNDVPDVSLRYGTVTAITGNTLSIKIGGDPTATTTVPKIAAYVPTVNDIVALLVTGKDQYLCLGRTGQNLKSIGATDMAVLRSNFALSGGGVIHCEAGHFWWTSRFIPIAIGRGAHFSTNGYFDLNPPASGTVIPGYGGAASATVTSIGGIPLAGWQALWAIPTIGGTNTQVTYAITHYTGDFVVPDHWIFIAVRNGDDGRVRCGNGQTYDYWRNASYLNGWTSYGGDYPPARYLKDSNGFVHVQAMMTGGTMAQYAFVLPAGYRPTNRLLHNAETATGSGRCDLDSAGGCIPIGGSNGWVSFMPPPFPAEV